MRDKTTHWGVLTVIGFIALIFLAHHIVPPPKARAQRISAVNSISAVSLTMTNANALPAIHR
jgi:hypothetical protein